MSRSFDALIVGAGVAGSACAIALARCGWKVALVERQVFPRTKVCGECLGSASFALLDTLGVGEQVRAVAGPALSQLVVMHAGRSIAAALPAAPAPYGFGRVVGREDLDTLLLAQAQASGVSVWQPWAVQSVQRTPGDFGRWHCSLRAPASQASVSLEAGVVIDAHGSWETQTFLAPAQRSKAPHGASNSQLLAFKAHFSNTSMAPGTLSVLLFDHGYGGMVMGGHGLATLACCIRRDRLQLLRRQYPTSTAGASVQAMLQAQCAGVEVALQNAQRVGPWLAAGPLVPGMHLRASDAVFRIGNAAGEAHPLIGEGMTMALQSAWLLSHTLIAKRGTTSGASNPHWQTDAAGHYAAQWALHLQPRLRVAKLFAQLALHRFSAAAMAALLSQYPRLLTRAAVWAGKADRPTSFSFTPPERPLWTPH